MGKKIVFWIGVPLVLAGLAAAGLAWAARAFDPCSNDLVDSTVSPDGRWVAAVYTRNCGATTRLSSNVSLVPSGETPEGPGNVFAAYETEIVVEWEDDAPEMLTIRHGPAMAVFRKESRYENVTVSYDETGPSQASLSRR